MSEYLSAAAAALGVPEDLLKRTADARATADGVSVDDLLAAWAGGAAAPTASPAAAPAPDSSVPSPPPEPETPTESAAPQPIEAAPASTAGSGGTVGAPPAPTSVRGAQALEYEAVVTVHASGIAERTKPDTPRWLAMLFLIVPLVGLTYLITFAAGPNCGVGGQLSVDRLTGEVENCDGTEFVAAGGGGGFDIRSVIVEGSSLYATAPGNCTACHGAQGQGGTGPALNGGAVLSTFAACSDHIEWVALATNGFQAAGRGTYGDGATAVGSGGVMSGFGNALTPEQLAAVVLFERVQFGGQDETEAATDCGFVDPAESDAAALDG